jgi:hypothetical protein
MTCVYVFSALIVLSIKHSYVGMYQELTFNHVRDRVLILHKWFVHCNKI